MISILIGGDICPMGRIKSVFISGKSKEIFNDLSEIIEAADISVANLECPMIYEPSPIKKAAVLGTDTKCMKGIVAAKWDILNLANNHSFDHGSKGLLTTISTIMDAGVNVVGAGTNRKQAQKPFIKEINNERIVIYAMAEREFSVADEANPGANPLDLISLVMAIQRYKKNGKFIVLLHGGKEFYPYPSPEMVRRCRFMVDMGADAVICSHTHCPLPWEVYKGRPIVYGMGNLIFEPIKKPAQSWHEGYLVKLNIYNNDIGLDIIPYIQSKNQPGAFKMNVEENKTFFNTMSVKNEKFKDSNFLRKKWEDYCERNKNTYLINLFAYNKIMRKFWRVLIKILHTKKDKLRALLLVQCETHQEVLNTIFNKDRVK